MIKRTTTIEVTTEKEEKEEEREEEWDNEKREDRIDSLGKKIDRRKKEWKSE